MLNIVTCNPVRVRNLLDYHRNFILVHCFEDYEPPRASSFLRFRVYHEHGMDLESLDEYTSDDEMVFDFVPVDELTLGFDQIAESIIKSVDDRGDSPDDGSDEERDQDMVAVCCGYDWNGSAVRYLKDRLRSVRNLVEPVNLYRELRIPSEDKLKDFLKMALGSEFIYMDDPVALAYALHQTIEGTFR